MRGTALSQPLEVPYATLVDTKGNDYDLRVRTKGKLSLLFFGYTHCPDVCPLHMANIAAVLRDIPFEQRSKAQVIFVTADPERDTPERLGSWLAKFDPSFVGLREKNPGDVAALSRALLLPNAVTMPTENGSYDVGHPSQVIVFDFDGVARYVYPFGTRQEDWAHDLRIFLGGTAPVPVDAAAVKRAEPPRPGAIRLEQVLIPEPPAETAALYATITNLSGDDTLLSILTPAAKQAALHETVRKSDGGMAMRHVGQVPLPAGKTLRLAPGGFHGMLLGFAGGYPRGATVPVVFEFEKAGRIAAAAKVVGYEEIEHAAAHEEE